jgi:hypothetical protein
VRRARRARCGVVPGRSPSAGRMVARSPAARSWARTPRLSGGCAGQGEQRRGSPRWWRDDGAERRLDVAVCGGVLTRGRVGGDSG